MGGRGVAGKGSFLKEEKVYQIEGNVINKYPDLFVGKLRIRDVTLAVYLESELSRGKPQRDGVSSGHHSTLGGLNNRCLFLKVLEAGKSTIKMPADMVPGEGPFPSL